MELNERLNELPLLTHKKRKGEEPHVARIAVRPDGGRLFLGLLQKKNFEIEMKFQGNRSSL